MAKREREKRFSLQKDQTSSLDLMSEAFVIVDRQTGVNYLYVGSSYGGGLTPLLDRDGRPIITPVSSLEEP